MRVPAMVSVAKRLMQNGISFQLFPASASICNLSVSQYVDLLQQIKLSRSN